MPDLAGKLAIVTGANSGLGLETTRALASKGAKVILACRDRAKAELAIDELVKAGTDESLLEFRACDLSSLASIRRFCEGVCADHSRLDLLINNAGVMALPHRKTADGFEMQIGTNHLGHFALTGQLLGPLLATEGARVVTVSSMAHRIGRINLDDLQSTRRYQKWVAYAQSKFANLLFANELQRRLEARARAVISVAAHPGYASTNLVLVAPRMTGNTLFERASMIGNRVVAQSATMGALPSLYAATVGDVKGGEFFGPQGLLGMSGYPGLTRGQAGVYDRVSARRLWDLSVELTGVSYEGLLAA
jgi:NAD(P)-dependent dehydrogenase (short-subunit alcohol dehydrogenase family)